MTEGTINDNDKSIELLKEKISGNVAVFVGSGTSNPLGIKTWTELLIELAERFGIDKNEVINWIKDKGHPKTASEIYKKIDDPEKYLDFLSEQFEPTVCNFTSAHEQIIDNFEFIFTTNFDTAFENVINKRGSRGQTIDFSVQKFPNFNPFNLSNEINIVYLHGNNNERRYIFREEEYKKYYPSISGESGSYQLENFLKDIFTKMNLIFIGFSFDDRYLTPFLRKMIKEETLNEIKIYKDTFGVEPPKSSISHFAFVSDDNPNIDEIREIGLNLIIYKKGRYVEIENILESIMPTSLGSIEEEGAYAK